jgi:ABC-type Zn uptake system ZnuABC Zn-binding protein ZnuA
MMKERTMMMRTTTMLLLATICFMATAVQAEFLEIEARQIATIEPTDKSASPRIVVEWDLPADLDKKIVDAAVITMTLPATKDEPLTIDVYPMTTSWDAKSAHWASGWEKAGGDYDKDLPSTTIVTEKSDGEITVDVYLSVLDQVAGDRDNFGFILVPVDNENARLSAITANDATKLADAKLIIAYRNQR